MKRFIPDYAFFCVTRLVKRYRLGNANIYTVYVIQMYYSRFIDHVLEMHNNAGQEKKKTPRGDTKSTSPEWCLPEIFLKSEEILHDQLQCIWRQSSKRTAAKLFTFLPYIDINFTYSLLIIYSYCNRETLHFL